MATQFLVSDLKGVTRVLDMRYMKILRVAMRVISAWPSKELGDETPVWEKPYAYYLTSLDFVCLIMANMFLKNNIGKIDFFELGHTYITMFMNAVSLTRNILIFQQPYRDISKFFVTKIHLFHRKDESEYAMKMHLFIHKICQLLTFYVLFSMAAGIVLFNLTPVYNNIQKDAYHSVSSGGNVTLEHSVYMQHFFDYTSNFKGYFVVFFFNWYISVTASTTVCAYDLYLSILVFHVWGHLKILIYNLEHFPRPARMIDFAEGIQVEWFTEEETRQAFLKLRELAEHHALIIDFVSNMSDTFGLVLFVYMGFHQISLCILMLECSALDVTALLRYGPLTVILFHQLIQISIIFELLGAQTDSLLSAVYNLPWECMEVSERKIVHMILRQSQLSLSTKALDMVDVGCGTMVSILKTTLSYFVMLKTLATED